MTASRCGEGGERGVNIKQTQAFEVQPNTNTAGLLVVTTYLFPLVIHELLVECLCLQRAHPGGPVLQ